MDLLSHNCYRSLIKGVFQKRTLRNPQYSLRAFSGDLGVSVSHLSEVLQNKANFSEKKGEHLGQRLGMNSVETEYFQLLFKSELKKSREMAEHLRSKAYQFRRLHRYKLSKKPPKHALDQYDFYDSAVLEYLTLNNLPDKNNICDDLQISPQQLTSSLNHLRQLGLIEWNEDTGAYRPTQDHSKVGDGPSSTSVRRYHQQLIKKGLDCLENQPLNERDIRSVVFSIQETDYEKIVKILQEAVCNASEEFDHKETNNRIYALCTQFFPLTPTIKRNPNDP